jgi:hypothetical protein
MLAAVTVTSADLVFTGELGGDFLVLDARDGTVVHRYHVGSAMSAGIVTYQVAGKQYVAAGPALTTRFWRTARAGDDYDLRSSAPSPAEGTATPSEKTAPPAAGSR